MTQQIWNLPRNDWLDYGNSNCQQVFKHLKQDSETISRKGTYHFKVQNKFSSLVKLENGGGAGVGGSCFHLWFACCHLCKDQTKDFLRDKSHFTKNTVQINTCWQIFMDLSQLSEKFLREGQYLKIFVLY